MTPRPCSFLLRNPRSSRGLLPGQSVGRRRHAFSCRPARRACRRLSIVAIALAALAAAPSGLASTGSPPTAEKSWRTAVSQQYHERYRPAEIAGALSAAGDRLRPSEAAWSGLDTALREQRRAASRDLYTAIYGLSAISPGLNFAVSTSNGYNATAPVSGVTISGGIYPGIGAAIPRSTVAQEFEKTRLMLRIGTVLGLAYLAFLFLWVWATRIRPATERSARV